MGGGFSGWLAGSAEAPLGSFWKGQIDCLENLARQAPLRRLRGRRIQLPSAQPATVPGLWARGLLDACGGSLGKPLGNLLDAVLRPLGASWGPFGGLLGPLLGLLGASWGLLGASWGYVGRLGCHLGGKGSICRFVFPLWGPSWRRLGALWGRLGGLLGRLGALLGRLGALLGASWAVLGRSERPLGPSWAVGRPRRR